MFNTDYDIKVYSKEELVSEIFVRGSSVTFNVGDGDRRRHRVSLDLRS